MNYEQTLLERAQEITEEKLAEGLGPKAEIVVGSYAGNDENGRVIQLGFTPRAVMVKNIQNQSNFPNSGQAYFSPTIALQGVAATYLYEIVENGFRLTAHGLCNMTSYTYLFLAVK